MFSTTFYIVYGLYLPLSVHQRKLQVLNGDSLTNPATKAKTTIKVPEDEDRKITLRDIKLIMPTILILLFTVLIIVTVIPYAFLSVINQLKAVYAMEEAGNIDILYLNKKLIKHIFIVEAAAELAKQNLTEPTRPLIE